MRHAIKTGWVSLNQPETPENESCGNLIDIKWQKITMQCGPKALIKSGAQAARDDWKGSSGMLERLHKTTQKPRQWYDAVNRTKWLQQNGRRQHLDTLSTRKPATKKWFMNNAHIQIELHKNQQATLTCCNAHVRERACKKERSQRWTTAWYWWGMVRKSVY